MAVVSVGNFKLTADDPAYPIPADSNVDKKLWLVVNAPKSTPEYVHVEVTDVHDKVVSSADYPVFRAGTAVSMPKGANLATATPAQKNTPTTRRIGFWLE